MHSNCPAHVHGKVRGGRHSNRGGGTPNRPNMRGFFRAASLQTKNPGFTSLLPLLHCRRIVHP